jgi:hypothetical protein
MKKSIHFIYAAGSYNPLFVLASTVGELRTEIGSAFGIESDAVCRVNDRDADNSTRINDGSKVEFIRQTGRKG